MQRRRELGVVEHSADFHPGLRSARLEEEFGSRFVRVHRNCLVAREAIRGFERRVSADGDAHWEVLLRDVDEALPVSRRQQFIVREIGRDA